RPAFHATIDFASPRPSHCPAESFHSMRELTTTGRATLTLLNWRRTYLSRRLVGSCLAVLAAGILASTSGCGKKAAAVPEGAQMLTPVIAVEAKRQPVVESLSLVGSLLANELVEIKSEIEGTVQEIRFTEGQVVNKGDLLIRLDETKLSTAL